MNMGWVVAPRTSISLGCGPKKLLGWEVVESRVLAEEDWKSSRADHLCFSRRLWNCFSGHAYSLRKVLSFFAENCRFCVPGRGGHFLPVAYQGRTRHPAHALPVP